jgi:tetratricopeptide (TPR) repeat protein
MGLIDLLPNWLGGRRRTGALPCPPEADILKYKENHLPKRARARLEQHVAACQDCRELLVLLVRFPVEGITQQPALSEAEIQQQTARVIQFIEADERRRATRNARGQIVPPPQPGWIFRYRVPLAAAVMVCALVVGLYFITRSEPTTQLARQSLAQAMKEERYSQARLSGNFDYSHYKSTRGNGDSPDFHLQIAVNQLKSAESDSAPVEMRQMLARAYLAFGHHEQARQAQAILESLRARGVQTADVFNDLGVAQFQQESFDAAIAEFTRALEINPAYAEALFNRALAKESAGRYPEARLDWEQFINSTTDANWKAEANRHLAGLSNSSGLKR